MATARFIRVVSIARRPSGAFAGEEVQYGINFVEGDAGGVFPDAIREPLPQFDAVAIGEAESDATWDMAWGWKGVSKMTKNNQLGIANLFRDFWNTAKAGAPTTLQLEEIRITAFQAVPTPGGYPYSAIGGANVFYLKTPLTGSATATQQLPPQLSMAVSLRTGARGPGGRGRFYTPFVGVGAASGLLDPTRISQVGAATKTLLEGVRAFGPTPAVVNVRKGTYSGVNWISIGNQFDVQRRRREQTDETYTDTTLVL